MKTNKVTLIIITILLTLTFFHSAHSDNLNQETKENLNNLLSEMQRKHLNTGKFLTTIKKLTQSPPAKEYLEQKLIIILTQSTAAGSGMRAAWLLGEMKSKKAVPHLIRAKKDNHLWIRKAAELALKKIQ
ncbi:MAG: HEAT repeat domain-containing protein [Methyloligellaceae bacterium]